MAAEGERLAQVLGDAARRLAPRACPESTPVPAAAAGPFDASRVRLVARFDALSPGSRDALSPHLVAAAGSDAPMRLECTRDTLAALADAHLELAPLLAAHDLAHRPLARPRLMGVLNATPDSFSDGGRHSDPERAADAAEAMLRAGAELIDVGGESTRPGSEPVDPAEEQRRVLPVIEAVRARGVRALISIDTRRAAVAARALDAGADWVNDVSAGRDDPEMIPMIRERGCRYVLMHMQGTPKDMQRSPSYVDPVGEITEWLRERVAACAEAGVPTDRLVLDPGLGFGKRLEDNVSLVRRLGELRSLGLPLLLGPSRKTWLGRLTGVEEPDKRDVATAAAVALAIASGAEILRVHDVAMAAQAAAVASAHVGHLESERDQT